MSVWMAMWVPEWVPVHCDRLAKINYINILAHKLSKLIFVLYGIYIYKNKYILL